MTARDPLKGGRLGKRRQWGESLGWGGTTQGVGGGQWALAGPQESCVCPAEDLEQVVLWGPLEEPEQGRGSPGCWEGRQNTVLGGTVHCTPGQRSSAVSHQNQGPSASATARRDPGDTRTQRRLVGAKVGPGTSET